MYVWLWKRLPGNRLLRIFLLSVLAIGVLALLFEVLFPLVADFLGEELI